MEQGRIDQILSSRPEDRRAVFEEASGITKFKADKKEAIRKLEHTEANLLRLADVIREVKRQIGSLQRQAGKARRYKELQRGAARARPVHRRGQRLGRGRASIARARTRAPAAGARGSQEAHAGRSEAERRRRRAARNVVETRARDRRRAGGRRRRPAAGWTTRAS